MADHGLMCLRCRTTGHVVSDCKSDQWWPELIWMFDEKHRMAMDLEDAWRATGYGESVCERCLELNLPGLLNSWLPWKTQAELTQAFDDGHKLIRSVGIIGTAAFWEDCEVCRSFHDLTPSPSSNDQEILLIQDWTICRTAGETRITLDIATKRHYATCLVVTLQPSSEGSPVELPTRANRADALCLLEEDLEPAGTLGGRRIKQDELDYALIRERLSNMHEPTWIHLYVWEEVKQSRYRRGDRIEQLPQTIEDSITFTKNLGKQYLWVDSLCIDQEDHVDKDDQIQRMRDIYQGAYVTVIAVSGDSAENYKHYFMSI